MYPQVLPPLAPPLMIAKSLPSGYDFPPGGGYFFAASCGLMILGSFALRVSCASEFARGAKAKQARINAATTVGYFFIIILRLQLLRRMADRAHSKKLKQLGGDSC